MNNDAEVRLQVKIDDKEAGKGLDSLASKTQKIGQAFSSAGKKLTVGLTLPIVGLVAAGVKYNAEIETLSTSFEVMTGSADKAADIIERLKKLGAKTPFEVKDLAKTTNLLMSFGFEADNAIGTLSMLGDIAQGSSQKLETISRAFGKMSSSQKVGLEDINMMIDSGFNPLQEIAESTGESMKSLYDRISKGSMSVDEITKSMQRSTKEGGKYFKSMEKQSQTVEGRISTLKDGFNEAAGALTLSLLPVLTSLLQRLTSLTTWFANLTDGQRKMILTVMGLVAVVGPLLMLVGGLINAIPVLISAFTFLASPIGLIVLAVGALIGVFVYLMATSEEFRTAMYNIFNAVKSDMTNTIYGITGVFKGLIGIIKGAVLIIGGLLNGDMKMITNGLGDLFKGVGNVIIGVFNLVLVALEKFVNLSLIPINTLIDGLNLVPNVNIKKVKLNMPKIPKLAVGTNNVAQDGLAFLHQGEAVVPKKYNPAVGGGIGGQQLVVHMPNIELNGRIVSRELTPYITQTVKLGGGNI